MATNITGTEGFVNGAIKLPSAKDSGSDVFQTLEDFMTRLAAHTHEGNDSKIINRNLIKDTFPTDAATSDWTNTSDYANTGNKYVTTTITTQSLGLRSDASVAGSTIQNITVKFYYYATSVPGTGGIGHVEFFPDYEWGTSGVNFTIKIISNLYEAIDTAGGPSPSVIVKVY